MRIHCHFLIVAVVAIAPRLGLQAQPSPSRPAAVPRDSLVRWLARASNAGRWGAADELGTLNHIGPAARRRAASLVREGITVSLAHEVVPGTNPRAISPVSMRFWSARFDSTVTWGLDSTTVLAHGWSYSHIDALSHSAWEGRLYNGVTVDALAPGGAQRLGIQAMSNGIVTRGVLIDMPRLLGVPYLEPGTIITVADIQRWERETGTRIDTGDVVLIRTGRWAREAALGTWNVTRGAAGPHPAIALYLHERGVAALGGDVANEYYPSVVAGISEPLHEIALTAMGMPLMDNLDFEAAAIQASTHKRWTAMFVVAPPRMRGGSGSLVNPLLIF